MKFRALIVQHEQSAPPGYIREWLDEQKAEIDLLRIDEEVRSPDPREYELLISLGSDFAAYDDSVTFIRREAELMLGAASSGVPVLGVCFGSQLLAKVMGGTSLRARRPEIGWLRVRTHLPALVTEGPWFEWHRETFTLPPGASLIAESDIGPQAYTIGRSLGLQFHLEVTPEIIEAWVRGGRQELDAAGIDPAALMEESRRRAPETRQATKRLLNNYLNGIFRGEA